MSGRQSKFKNEWKEHPQFRDWLGEIAGDAHMEHCKFCRKSFDVSNMGVSALKRHAQGQGHIKTAGHLKTERRMTDFMRGTTNKAPQTATVPLGKWHGNIASQGSSTVTQGS